MTHQPNPFRQNLIAPPRPTPVTLKFTLKDRRSDLLVKEVQLLRDCVALAQKHWDFTLDAAVVLPAQMQLLGVFNTGEFGIRQAVASISSAFQAHCSADAPVWENAGEFKMLEWEALPLRRAFIEAAPVRLGLVDDPADWAFSSAQRTLPQARALGVAVA